MKKAIFLDRDGILNKPIIIKGKPYVPTIIKDFTINYKFLTVTKYLKSLNYLLIMLTNQPDVNKKKNKKIY
jgi:D-glycero-D-manno-heptose 1,7-bisphosphate phosphatase